MGNWQLIGVVLASVLVGAFIPLFIIQGIVLYRVSREIVDLGKRLKPSLNQIQIISDRLEALSRGFDGGAQSIAELLAAMGSLARGLERNMNIINISSAVMAAAGPAIAAFIRTMHGENEFKAEEAEDSSGSDDVTTTKNNQDLSSTPGSRATETPSQSELGKTNVQPLPNKTAGTQSC